MDLIDILVGIVIISIIILYGYLRERERERIWKLEDESVRERYIQIITFLMRKKDACLIDMMQDKVSVEFTGINETKWIVSIQQTESSVNFTLDLTTNSKQVRSDLTFSSVHSQEDMILKIDSELERRSRNI